jgi:hypothetical protein
MGRGNGNLLFNLALILIFCHLSKQPACCGREEGWGRGWPGFLRTGQSCTQGLVGGGASLGEPLLRAAMGWRGCLSNSRLCAQEPTAQL